jgi:ribosome recycling factor
MKKGENIMKIKMTLLMLLLTSTQVFGAIGKPQEAEEKRNMLVKYARAKYLKSPEEIRNMSKTEIKEIRQELKDQDLWDTYKAANGRLANVKNKILAQRMRSILLKHRLRERD